MASAMTAQQLVDITRDYVGIYDQIVLRDGFSTDDGEADIAILPFINQSTAMWLMTGFVKCQFYMSAVAGKSKYKLPQGCGSISYIRYAGTRLEKKTMAWLDRNRQGWLSAASGTPSIYATDISDFIVVYPSPLTSDALVSGSESFEMLAVATLDDLVDAGDVLTRIPVEFHGALAVDAAGRVLRAMGNGAKADTLPLDAKMAYESIQALAQHRQIGETTQIEVLDYHDQYRRGISGLY